MMYKSQNKRFLSVNSIKQLIILMETVYLQRIWNLSIICVFFMKSWIQELNGGCISDELQEVR
jgi:hypothetical protein